METNAVLYWFEWTRTISSPPVPQTIYLIHSKLLKKHQKRTKGNIAAFILS